MAKDFEELEFHVGCNLVTVSTKELIITRLYEKAYTIQQPYDGTVGGMAKAINTIKELDTDDFKMFAGISKAELEDLEDC